ncbi:tRNA dihydrouridine synthase DusB [Pseudoruminococcus massiliensis]|uniref:tRNA dihydrouridine synthase DusB n=1 Tax=Pseudoruminococcus massiliensis TaxID=2086583 RepID=UPI003AB646AC
MKIGNVEIKGMAALAPMAGVTDRAFRELCVAFGASYVVGEMVSAKGISFNSERSKELMLLSENERPAAVQLFGSEPQTVAAAAVTAMEYKPDIIDINMGCPAPKISGNGAGSALMKNPDLCGKIVEAVCKAVDVPITVKIRKGWDDKSVNAVEVAKICEQAGASAITVHGRTREQFYSGKADLDIISEVKKAVNIPVIGNGDITNANDAAQMLEKTNCDMVMIGRGALGNPWIFREINAWLNDLRPMFPPSPAEKVTVILRHIQAMCDYKGEEIAMREARKHVGWYMKGFKNAAELRREAGYLKTYDELIELTKKAYECMSQSE